MKMDGNAIVLSLCVFLVIHIKTEAAVTNVAFHKSVSASTVFPYAGWEPDKAVDGVINQTHTADCSCCAATNNLNSSNPWFKVDLGAVYMVHNLSVYGRENFKTTDIFLHNETGVTGSPTITINKQTNTFHHMFTSPVIARYVTVKYRGQRNVFVLCEIQAFGECVDGTFDANCNSKCYCDGSPCNKTTGVCPSGRCIPGYTGEKCDQICSTGYYGQNCSERCGHCRNKTCHNVNGVCTPCEDGYTGDMCKQECPTGKYGKDCAEFCGNCRNNENCNHVNGDCSLCSDGYTGKRCKNKCLPGTYGYNCSKTCGNCYNNDACDHVAGNCTQCMAGYVVPLCKANCISGWYGQNCANKCGACAVDPCHPVSGVCTECSPGYRNEFCNEACLPGSYGKNCSETCGSCYENEPCDHVDGKCKQCMAGYKGSTCKNSCTSGSYGLDCKNQCGKCAAGSCNPVSGVCTNCSAGYRTEYCNETCVAGTFGVSCNSTCGICSRNTTCHHINGQCVSRCKNGNTWINCSLDISKENTSGGSPKSLVLFGVVGVVFAVLVIAIVIGVVFIRKKRFTQGTSMPSFIKLCPAVSEEISFKVNC